MALIDCPECNKEISDKSDKCINCGFPLDVKQENNITEIKEDSNSLKKEKLVCQIEIKGNEDWSPTSPYLHGTVAILMLLMIIISIFSKEFWEGILVTLVLGSIGIYFANIIYVLTPFYWKKKKNNQIIYEYFKKRFHTISDFDYKKHEKIDEFNEIIETSYKSLENDELLFQIYMKAFNKNADAVMLDKINETEVNCILIKYK